MAKKPHLSPYIHHAFGIAPSYSCAVILALTL
jgi:hypothetical protein